MIERALFELGDDGIAMCGTVEHNITKCSIKCVEIVYSKQLVYLLPRLTIRVHHNSYLITNPIMFGECVLVFVWQVEVAGIRPMQMYVQRSR